MTHDDAWLDDVAAYAAGALTPVDAARVREHIAGCAACAAEYAELAPVVGALAYTQEAEPSALLKQRVMRAVRAEALPRRASPYAAYALAAACFAAAVAASLYAWSTGERNAQTSAQIAAITAPGTQAYPVPNGEVFRSGPAVYLAVRRLPRPPAGKVYQAWTLRRGAKTMTPSITFVPETHAALIRLPVDGRRLAAVALSVEPAGGSKQPTSAPVFVVKFE